MTIPCVTIALSALFLATVQGEETLTTNSTGDDDYYDYDYYTSAPEGFPISVARTHAFLPKPLALLSMICSYVMLREVIADQRSNCGTPITRTLLSMAIADIIFSFALFLGAWPSPSSIEWLAGTNNGNHALCTFQGFMWAFGFLSSCFFNASLSILYLLMVRYSWTNSRLHKLEPWLQGSIWIFSLAIALYPIPLKMYNNSYSICAIDTIPHDCVGDDCERGSNALPHQVVFTVLPWVSLLISFVGMGMLLCTVRTMENKSRKYASSLVKADQSQLSSQISLMSRLRMSLRRSDRSTNVQNEKNGSAVEHQVNRRKSQAVAMQGVCYALAFLMTYLLDLVSSVLFFAAGLLSNVLDYFAYDILMPSAGTFNFLVFARTRSRMKTPEGRFFRYIFCCTCCRRWTKRGGSNAELDKNTDRVQTEETASQVNPPGDSAEQVQDTNGCGLASSNPKTSCVEP